MSVVLGITRGSVKAIDINGGIKSSIIQISGVSSKGSTTLVSNFSVQDNEKLGMIQCFNNVNHLYAFGHDPENSGFSVTYIAFLGKECMKSHFTPGNAVKDLVSAYNDNKVSKGTLATVSFGGGKTLEGVILNMNIEVFSPELNAVTVTISGKALRWHG